MEIFDEIIKYVGSQAQLGRLLGITGVAVGRWNKVIPIKRVIEIETALNGKFSREQMRPDYYPPVVQPVNPDDCKTSLTNGGQH